MTYTNSDLEKVANKIWRGKFPKTGASKWADTYEVGISFSRDRGLPAQWTQVSEKYEMKVEKCDITIGRVYVRKVN